MATEIRDASGALIGHQLDHTAQQVDDGLESVKSKAEQTALEAETAARQAADKSIQTALESETTARQAADTALENRIDAAYIVETAEGAVASFDDGADGVPLKSCVVQIDYAAGGRAGVTVVRTGVNLVNTSSAIGQVIGEDITTSLLLRVNGSTLPLGVPLTAFIRFTDGTDLGKNLVATAGSSSIYPGSYATLQQQPSSISFYTNAKGIESANGKTIAALGIATAIGDYGPYSGTTYSITFPVTIYGGTLDVTTGVLTSTLDAEGNSLATPQVYQLEPQEIRTLLGTNNIWADCGNVSVEYRADPTLAYNELKNAILSTGGNV